MRLRRARMYLLTVPAAAALVLPLTGVAAGAGPAQARVAVGTDARPAHAPAARGWRTLTTIAVPARLAGFIAIASAGPSHAWAVGAAAPASGSPEPLVATWNGRSWAPVGLPPPVAGLLTSAPELDTAAASRPGNFWAFTMTGGWLHGGSGGTWTAGTLSSRTMVVSLLASLAFGKGSAWALGGVPSRALKLTPYAAHFVPGKGWRRTPVPGKGQIAAASAVSSRDLWAVLGNGLLNVRQSPGGLLHWSRGRWRAVSGVPVRLRNGSLGSVLAFSDPNLWVGGAIGNRRHGTTEALGHWNGRRWRVIMLRAAATSARFHITSMVHDGHGGIWALGTCVGPSCPGGVDFRLWHEAGGKWSRPITPDFGTPLAALLGLAAVPHAVWGAGGEQPTRTTANGLIALWGPVPR